MLKTVIIGTGAIAYCHAEAVKKLGVEIAGVYDINRESAKALAGKYATTVIEDLPAAVGAVDMVHICTPPSFRVEYAKLAMEAGCHVVMEKPMAITLEDAETMVSMAKQRGVKLMVDFNHRFRFGFQRLLDVVKSGVLGDPVSVYVYRMGMLGGNAGTKNDTWRRKAGTVCGMSIESLSHDIDMIYQLAGPIEAVKADIRGTFADVPQFDNNANVSFTMKSGAMGLLHASWSSCLKSSSRGVIGSKGAAVLEGDDLFDFTRLRVRTLDMEYEQVTVLNDVYNFATCPSYRDANAYFIRCITENLDSSVSGEHALETLRISHTILEAANSPKTVTLIERR